ncbi:MAG: tannase/feruloyl esterase family alpha/beta hydrolase [Verrucomicrobia bacterium]|nr:MAG: tannase/feruloyl esterase family alpha/beta hydrolase [Verrucomicrobiota bacterium]
MRAYWLFTLVMRRLFVLGLIIGNCVGSGRAAEYRHISLEDLRNVRLPEVALESVKEAGAAEGKGQLKPHVELTGIIGGHIRFELLLPDEWNGRFVMGGGGGFVGTVQNAARYTVNLGYATVGTDTGHQSAEGHMAGWALNDLEAKVNFGYLAVHRTAETAKALIRAYYTKEPERSYFIGCSRGGGQAMMEAQRFPQDFDGIVAGAPAFDWTGLASTMVSIAKVLYPDPAHLETNVVTKEALQKLQAGVLDQCDAQDGLKDGVIQDPAAAHFELAKVPGLTDEQRKAFESIYSGAHNGKGLIYPGFAPAAECVPEQWIAWITGPAPQLLAKDHVPDLTFAFGTQIYKYLIFNDPDWDYSKYDFSNFDKDTRLGASFLNANNPDLGRLKARNGKLIIWHGWADPALPAQGTINYYRHVMERDTQAAAYCRLFMVPGCLHCGGGPGASEVDWLTAIVDWVEHGQAPDKLIASKKENGKVTMTRPVYPYPKVATYKGTGDVNSADSFSVRP